MLQKLTRPLLAQSLLLLICFGAPISSSLAHKVTGPIAPANPKPSSSTKPASKPYYESPRSHFVDILAGLPPCSLAQLNKSIADKPHTAMPYIRRGLALLGDGDEAALADFKKALTLEPHSALAHIAMSRWYQSQQQWPQAFAELQAGVRLGSGEVSYKALWESAFLHRERGDSGIAIKQYDLLLQATKPSSDRASLLFQKGETYCRDKRFKLAFECCDQALKLNSNLINAYSCRGLALSQLGKINEAIADFSHVIGLDHSADPPPPQLLTDVYTMRSNLYQFQGKTALARSDKARSLAGQSKLLNEMPFRLNMP